MGALTPARAEGRERYYAIKKPPGLRPGGFFMGYTENLRFLKECKYKQNAWPSKLLSWYLTAQ